MFSRSIRLVVAMVALSTFSSSISHAELYGQLEKAHGQWRFTSITNNKSAKSVVDLYNIDKNIPYNTSSSKCTEVFFMPKDCDSKGEFRTYKTDWPNTIFKSVMMAGIPFILGLRDGNIEFDSDGYKDAVHQAFKADNIDTILIQNTEYEKLATARTSEYNTHTKEKYDALYQKYYTVYESGRENIKLSFSIKDNTGLWNGELDNDVHVKNMTLDMPSDEVNYYKEFSFTPSVEPDKVKVMASGIDSIYQADIASLQQKLKEYEKTLVRQTSEYSLPHDDVFTKDGFVVQIDAPKTVAFKGTSIQKVPVLYTVVAKNFKNVYPKYSNSDSNLEARFDGKNLDLINRTDYFLQVKTISVYYNSDIYNYTFNDVLELAPGAVKKDIAIDTIVNDKIRNDAETRIVDAKKAKSTDILFGFAFKYRLVEQNVDKTLYKQVSSNLFKVLKNANN